LKVQTTKSSRREAVFEARKLLRVFVPSWFIVFALISTVRADEQWILTTADFKSETVSIRSIDDSGIHVPADGGDERTIAMDHFLQLDRVGQPHATGAPKLFLWLIDGDHVGGAPVGVSGESLNWHSPGLGDLSFPLAQVRAIQRSAQPPPQSTPSGTTAPRTEDVLTLANGDTLRGIISDLNGETISLQLSGGDVTPVPLTSIAAADFATPAGISTAPQAVPKRGFRVTTSDGTVITTDSIKLAGRELHVMLPGAADRPIPLSSLSAIEQINGPVLWLSSLAPSENVQIPAFSQHIEPAQMDRTVSGDPIRFNDREFTHGIGVHSYSRLVFRIDPGCTSFRTQFAIDGDQPWADVTVRVKLDDHVAFEKPHVTSGTLSDVVKLDLDGAKTLTLEVDYGDNYDVQDRLNWIEPALLRSK
jgi:hypothetical protein